MLQIAIAVGYSNVNVPTLRRLLAQHTSEGQFKVNAIPDLREEPYSYMDGCIRAEELAVSLALRRNAPLCIGIVAVLFMPTDPSFHIARLEIAVLVERGEPKKPLALTPRTTHNAAVLGSNVRHPHETHFATEAALTLMETIKTCHRTLHLV